MKSTRLDVTPAEPQVVRCYLYARTARSNALAIERQIQDGHALAESLSSQGARHEVVRVFQDDGGSGLSGDRPGYTAMLAGLERGEATVVVVWSEERLYRDANLQKAYSEMSDRLGVTTHSVRSGRVGR
ncbi:recombinase family protein [Streptomyces sp. NPDC057430]|uniref:recombinase family protein n=1 Tax=Streptomyces sp. NPDC057430 TaxID=3346131 RepID=UPI0036956EB5